ncbi:MAG: AsmA family protein [Bacteroidetes bacterium]|jgi:hypothetical protein|nr:AsmA family protein [Bacteroidota bacterium]
MAAKTKIPFQRILRIILLSAGSLVALFLLAAILIPILFKDRIHEAVKREINNNLNKEVAELNYGDMSLSLFSHFPHVSIRLEDLSIRGKGVFASDTLLATQDLQAAVSLFNLFFEDVPEIIKVRLVAPRIKVVILADGRANYDIALPDSSKPEPDAEPLRLNIRSFELQDADIIYDDPTMPVYTHLRQLDLETGVRIHGDLYDVENELSIADALVDYDGVPYLNHIRVGAKMALEVDNAKSRYTLKENEIELNELGLTLSGLVEMPTDDIRMDLKFATTHTGFKQLLSLVPAMYTQDFDKLEADGSLAFSGYARGVYNDTQYPAFNVKMQVKNGSFHYPDLPAKVTDIQVDAEVNSPGADLEQMQIQVRRLHANLAGNPLDAHLLMKGLTNAYYEAGLKARLNLKTLATFYPIEGLSLAGELALDARVKGRVEEEKLPNMQVVADMKYGYLKSNDFPAAIENLNFHAELTNTEGTLQAMELKMPHFHAEIDKQPISAAAFVKNFDDPSFRLKLAGTLDLKKLGRIYPMEGTEMAGTVQLDVDTEGQYSQLQSNPYSSKASGRIAIKDLYYKSTDLPQGLSIRQAELEVQPAYLALNRYEGKIGKSDLNLKGRVENYLGYLIKGDVLKGNLELKSAYLDANEWMSEDAPGEQPQQAEEATVAEPLPANVAFVFRSQIDKILYDKMELTNFVGNLELRDQTLYLRQNTFKLLQGDFALSGLYAAKTGQNPAFDLDFRIQGLGMQEAYNNLGLVQKLAPVARQVDGRFGTNFVLKGQLDRELNPVYETVYGKGFVAITEGTAKNIPALKKLSAVTQLANFDQLDLGGTRFDFEIKGGRLYVQPFDVKRGNTRMNIGGSNGLDGSLDYLVKLDLPTGEAGKAAATALSQFTGQQLAAPDRIAATMNVGGTYDKPTIKKVGGAPGTGTGDAKSDLKAKADEKLQDLKDKGQEKIDQTKAEAEQRLQEERKALEAKAEAERKAAEARMEQQRKELEAKAAAEKKAAEEKAKKALEEQKKKLPIPKW